ncbi:MAG TPA: Shedu immune nuclease family protein [Kineosporiaceae bacterium]|nr:Shedu immune nuclease family protein [Kineosporiaceae bacterium]
MPEVDEPDFYSIADEDASETEYAQGRLPGKVYASRGFTETRSTSSDVGQPARFIYKVVDTDGETRVDEVGEEWHLFATPEGRYHFKLKLVRFQGRVKEMWIQRVPEPGRGGNVKNLLHLKEPEAKSLIDMLKALDQVPLEGVSSVRVDDAIIQEVFREPGALSSAYERDPNTFRELIRNDKTAKDVIAVTHRRHQVEIFRELLTDPAAFARAKQRLMAKGPEDVWQRFFEQNPWILGMGLGGQLLTSWSKDKLEQITTGRSISHVGKRVDALLETSGIIKSLVFAEIKRHDVPLLHTEYRDGCWSPSEHLTGGAAQAHGTVHLAIADIAADRIAKLNEKGFEVGEFAYVFRPKSYLIVGQLSEFIDADTGGHHVEKIRSFELYRSHLQNPEILTYDELLARAEWLVSTDQ